MTEEQSEDGFDTGDFNRAIIEEFRANHGRVGGMFEGARLLLLTTTGARSGRRRTTPLGFLPDGERILVIASAGGADRHPAWFHNLRAHPRVTVENGVFVLEADAVVLEGRERETLFARAAEADPGWAEYQAGTERTIPVVALHPVGGEAVETRMGEGLKVLHDAFRRELATIREEVARSGPALGAQLRINCLTVCQGLGHHHTMEDAGMFPGIAEARPELAGVIARLGEEHERVEVLLEQLKSRLADSAADPAAVAADVDRLVAELEGHLDYEEEQLVPVLDAMAP
ncbi:nitroreductase/quinone reductase family protein [Streptomonospora wellingtoniae]|uniref:Nitroreductase/quinone reductase family protein n=1 Tax=Streptomonospora wellingtoniae TaxID=3075544 RepID=A0ABU2KSJ6_9ACTN|nr:nitroreductase/quinone reductase family protein [Streptomonospora sp. DSM 45055]MDT0302247.1 nitroreductase/quinone reductase family protein [Streptomonospora sp. DSM 45055]